MTKLFIEGYFIISGVLGIIISVIVSISTQAIAVVLITILVWLVIALIGFYVLAVALNPEFCNINGRSVSKVLRFIFYTCDKFSEFPDYDKLTFNVEYIMLPVDLYNLKHAYYHYHDAYADPWGVYVPLTQIEMQSYIAQVINADGVVATMDLKHRISRSNEGFVITLVPESKRVFNKWQHIYMAGSYNAQVEKDRRNSDSTKAMASAGLSLLKKFKKDQK